MVLVILHVGFLWVCPTVIEAWGGEETTAVEDERLLPQGYPEHGIFINVPARTLVTVQRGRVTGSYPVAVGRPVKPTPTGDFKVSVVVYHPWWYPTGREPVPAGPENPLGPWWFGLDLAGYGIHGNNNEDSIGQFISDGCIRMHNSDVSRLAPWVQVGTPVRIVYEPVSLVPVMGADGGVQWHLGIYPDAYRVAPETDHAERVREVLQVTGARLAPWDQVSLDEALESNTVPVEVPVSLLPPGEIDPSRPPVFVAGGLLGTRSVRRDGTDYLPLTALLRVLGEHAGEEYGAGLTGDQPGAVHRVSSEGWEEVLDDLIDGDNYTVRVVGLPGQRDSSPLNAFAADGELYIDSNVLASRLDVTVTTGDNALHISWRELYYDSFLLARYADRADLGPSMVPACGLQELFRRRLRVDAGARLVTFLGRTLERVFWDEDTSSPWVCAEEVAGHLRMRVEFGQRRVVLAF